MPSAGDRVYSMDSQWPYGISAVGAAVPYTFGTLELVNAAMVVDSIKIKEMTVPAHPFYIRWINNLGGWEYFMFACEQKTTDTLSANDTFEPLNQHESIYGQRSAFYKAATKTIEVSTGVIDRQTLESISKAIFSPLIQKYDEDVQTWVEIQVKDGKPELIASQPTGEMIFVFELPTPQMNR